MALSRSLLPTLALLLPPVAAQAKPAPAPAPEPRMTAREAIEIQLAAPPAAEPRAPMTGSEARVLRKRYLDRIGQKLEITADVGRGSGR